MVGEVRTLKKYIPLLQNDMDVKDIQFEKDGGVAKCKAENDYYDGEFSFALKKNDDEIHFYFDFDRDYLTRNLINYLVKKKIKYAKHKHLVEYAKQRDKKKESKSHKRVTVNGETKVIVVEYHLFGDVVVEKDGNLYNFYLPSEKKGEYIVGISAPCKVLDSFSNARVKKNIDFAMNGYANDKFDKLLEKQNDA